MLRYIIRKTQVALEYVYRARTLAPDVSVFWIHASNQASFRKGFETIFHLAKREDSLNTDALDIKCVVDWLESSDSGRWIMVIDDIDLGTFSNQQLVHNALPRNSNGSIIFTTRNKQTALALVDSLRCVFQMEPMTYNEAYQLLKSQLNTDLPDTGVLVPLLNHLDHLPLAICRAASYMMMTSTPPNAYLQLFLESEESRADLLDQSSNTTLEGYEESLVSSLVSIGAIREQNEAAAQILFKIACVDPLHIPSALLISSSTPSQTAKALGLLKAYSLISSNDTGSWFDMHSLVHLGVRTYLKRNNQFYFHASEVFQTLARSFPEIKEQYSRLFECKSYLPHALAAWDAVIATGKTRSSSSINSGIAKTLASRISFYLRIMGRYEEAKRYAENALERCLDENSVLSAPALACKISVAAVDQYLGNIVVAAESINTVFRSQIHLLATNSPMFIPTLRRKGLLLQSQAFHAQAESYHLRAVHMSISFYGVDDIQTLDEKHCLALSLLGQRKHSDALSLLQYVLEAMGDTIGLKNPKTLSVLSNVGAAFQLQGCWEQSESFITGALVGREEVLGADHPHTLQCKANLAQVYVERGEPLKAEEMTRQVLQNHQAKLGKDHPLSVHILQNLGFLLLDQCRFWEAEEILRCVVRKREKCFGTEHCDTLLTMFYLAETYFRQEKFKDALALGREVLDIRQRTLSQDHPDVLSSEVQVSEMENT
jgi:tetratricopeptide (TPR) repeat protein